MRLQDIIVEKLNENVKFEYKEDSEGDNNRGWQVDEIQRLSTAKKLATSS